MDISIPVNGSRLNARVAVLLKVRSGYVLERDRSGFVFPVGGRIKINEDSESAAKREVKEEIGMELTHLRLIGIIENFFQLGDEPFHEFCFLYRAEVDQEIVLPTGFLCLSAAEFADHDIQPGVLREFVNTDSREIMHRVVRDPLV